MENPQESIRLSVKKVLLILFMLVLNRKCDDIQIDSRAHLASYSMGTEVLPLGGGKQLVHEVNHSAAFSAEVKNEWSCSSSA